MSRSSRHIPRGRVWGVPSLQIVLLVCNKKGWMWWGPPQSSGFWGGLWERCLWHGGGQGGCEPPQKGFVGALAGVGVSPLEHGAAARLEWPQFLGGQSGCQRPKFTPTVLCLCVPKVSWDPPRVFPHHGPVGSVSFGWKGGDGAVPPEWAPHTALGIPKLAVGSSCQHTVGYPLGAG